MQQKPDKRLYEEVPILYGKRKYGELLKLLQDIMKTDNDSTGFIFKAMIFRDKHEYNEAIKIINEGLESWPTESLLLKLKAEILARDLNKPEEALPFIKDAALYYEPKDKDFKEMMSDIPEIEKYKRLKYLITTGEEIRVLESEIRSMIEIKALREKSLLIAQDLKNERVKNIELLGIFTAIIAFIFSGVEVISRTMIFSDALVLLLGIALMLISFLTAISIFTDPKFSTKTYIYLFAVLGILILLLPLISALYRRILCH